MITFVPVAGWRWMGTQNTALVATSRANASTMRHAMLGAAAPVRVNARWGGAGNFVGLPALAASTTRALTTGRATPSPARATASVDLLAPFASYSAPIALSNMFAVAMGDAMTQLLAMVHALAIHSGCGRRQVAQHTANVTMVERAREQQVQHAPVSAISLGHSAALANPVTMALRATAP